jgi:hypothetical protein
MLEVEVEVGDLIAVAALDSIMIKSIQHFRRKIFQNLPLL